MQDFELSSYSGVQAAAGGCLLDELPGINAVRRRHAVVLSDGLNGLAGIRIPGNRPGSEPIALRYPVVVDDLRLKRQVLDLLARGGIAASEMYGRESYDLIRQSAFRAASCPNAEFLCERMINLPTHAYVRRCDLETMIDVFRRVLPPSEGRDALATSSPPPAQFRGSWLRPALVAACQRPEAIQICIQNGIHKVAVIDLFAAEIGQATRRITPRVSARGRSGATPS